MSFLSYWLLLSLSAHPHWNQINHHNSCADSTAVPLYHEVKIITFSVWMKLFFWGKSIFSWNELKYQRYICPSSFELPVRLFLSLSSPSLTLGLPPPRRMHDAFLMRLLASFFSQQNRKVFSHIPSGDPLIRTGCCSFIINDVSPCSFVFTYLASASRQVCRCTQRFLMRRPCSDPPCSNRRKKLFFIYLKGFFLLLWLQVRLSESSRWTGQIMRMKTNMEVR